MKIAECFIRISNDNPIYGSIGVRPSSSRIDISFTQIEIRNSFENGIIYTQNQNRNKITPTNKNVSKKLAFWHKIYYN